MLGSVLYLSANDGSAQCGGEVGRTRSSFFEFCETQGFFLFSQVALKSQKLDHMVSVEKKTAPTMDPTNHPKITQISIKLCPFSPHFQTLEP